MPIKIDWIDGNDNTIEYYLYKSETPIPDNPLPTPLATIPAGTTTYTDLDTPRNKLFYYRVACKNVDTISLSVNKPLTYMPYTGPGPNVLLRGTWEFGYFGTMNVSELIAPADLLTMLGLTGVLSASTDNVWAKIVYKGRVMFVPSQHICTNLSWENIYKAGAMYGNAPSSQWPALAKSTYGTIPQGKTVSKGDHVFTVITPSSRANPLSTSTAIADCIGGDVDIFTNPLYRVHTYPFLPGIASVDDINWTGAGGNSTITSDLYGVGTQVLMRGDNTSADSVVQLPGYNMAAVLPNSWWRPMLELVI